MLQESNADGQQSLVCAFQRDDGVRTINVKPIGLAASTTYEGRSVDAGLLGTGTGSDLMPHGIDLVQSPNTAAHIVMLKAK